MPSQTSRLDVDPATTREPRTRSSILDVPATQRSSLYVNPATLRDARAALLDTPATQRALLDIDKASIRVTVSGGRYYSWLDFERADFPPIPVTGALEVTAGFTGFESTAGAGTIYLGAGIDVSPQRVWLPWPVAVTITDIAVSTNAVVAGVGNSFAYTVQKNGIDTGVVLTIAGGSATSALAGSLSLTFAAGDRFGFKLVKTGAVPAALHSWTVKTS